jgi:hypothetical protein
VSFALQIFVGHLSWLKHKILHWDHIDRLKAKSNSIRTAIQENIYDDNIHFIGIKQLFLLKGAQFQPDYSYWLKA